MDVVCPECEGTVEVGVTWHDGTARFDLRNVLAHIATHDQEETSE